MTGSVGQPGSAIVFGRGAFFVVTFYVFFAEDCLSRLVLRALLFCRGLTPPPAPRRRPRPRLLLGVFGVLAVVVVRLMWRKSAPSPAFCGERGTCLAPRVATWGITSPRPPDGEAPPRLCLFRSLQTAVLSSVVVDKRLLRGERLLTCAYKQMRGSSRRTRALLRKDGSVLIRTYPYPSVLPARIAAPLSRLDR